MSLGVKSIFLRVMLVVFLSASTAFPQTVQVVPIPSAIQPPSVPSQYEQRPQSPYGTQQVQQPTQPQTGTPIGYPQQQIPPYATPPAQQPPVPQPAIPQQPPVGMPSALPPQPVLQGVPVGVTGYEAPGGKPSEELSPFEQYVAGKMPTAISFDIKQFGYDLFQLGNQQQGVGSDVSDKTSGTQSTYTSGTASQSLIPPSVLQQQVPAAPQAPAPQPPSSQKLPALGVPTANVPVGPDYVLGPGDEVRLTVWGGIEGTWNTVVDRDGNINIPKVGTIGVTGLNFQQLKEVLRNELSKYYKDFQMNVSLGALRTMTVYVVGNARNPGSYTVSSLSTIINALVVAGGPSKSGTMRDIQLKRNGETICHLDLYDFLIYGDKSKDMRLLPEDVIFIPSIGPLVGVAGNVERPAIYELKGKTSISEAIKMGGGTTAVAYLQRVQVERVFQKETKIVVDVNLEKFKGKHDIQLQDGDIVKVFPIYPMVTNRIVLQGNVKRPGEYEWKPGMRARDLIGSTEALLPDAFFDYAMITRLVPPDYHQEYRSFDLGAMLLHGDEKNNVLLEPYDVVTVFNKWEMMQKEKVRVTGAVNKPGEYDYKPNMKLSDLLKLAGGLKKFAYGEKAELTRVTPLPTGPLTEQIIVEPEKALNGESEYDIALQQDDYLFVRAIPDWNLYRKVNITGEVKFPGDYALRKGEYLSSLIERAGGFTNKAYLRGTTFLRLSVRDAQQKQLNDMIARLEREILASSSADVGAELTPQDAQIMAYQAKQKQLFLDSLKRVQATGRMVVDIDKAMAMKGSPADVELEDGDFIYIPPNPQTVQVVGAVNSQASFAYNPDKGYSYYIDRAGGFTRTADKGEIYIVKADGSTAKPGWSFFWNNDSNRWESGSPNQIEAGDTIVVPEELDRIAWLRNIKDITQILYQTAVGAAVVLRAFD